MMSLLPEDLANQNLFIFTAAGIVPCGGHKTSSRTSLHADYFFWSFERSLNSFLVVKNRVPLKPVLEGVAGVSHLITGHEQNQ